MRPPSRSSRRTCHAVSSPTSGYLRGIPQVYRRPSSQDHFPLLRYRIPVWGARTAPTASELQLSGSDSSLNAARSYSWISPPRILRRRIRAARSVTVAVVMSSASGGPQLPEPLPGTGCLRYRRYTTGPAAAGPVSLFLASASRYISGTTSRDHESCPASRPTPDATAVHFRLSGLDLCGLVLAPCLLGCAGRGR